MSAPPPTVVPILATPFGVLPLPEVAAQNLALAALFAAKRAADRSGRAQNPLCYRSGDDLLEWSEGSVRQLAAGMLRGVCQVVDAVNEFGDGQLQSFKLEARGWFTVVESDGCVPAALHPLTTWCAVYCVAAPAPSASRRDSGLLRLHESRFGTMFPDATNSVMRLPFKPGHYGWQPVPGQMAVFPASIIHEIATVRATEPLVLVTCRVRFVAPGQQGVGRW